MPLIAPVVGPTRDIGCILTNGSVYLGAFILYAAGWWSPTFEGVMALFALGILVDSFLTLFFLVKALYLEPPNHPSNQP